MINVFKKPLLPLIGLLTLVVVLTSCEKDENGNSGKIELLSFGPSGVRHGDTLSFVGTNLNKVTAIQFTGEPAALVEQKDFKQQTSEIILLIVPPAAEKGYVTLKTPEGDIVTKTLINLDALTAFNSFTPQARPGENITITGDYLNWVTSVTFARDKIVESFVSQSIDELVVTVPADAETGPLILSFGGSVPGEVQSDDTLIVTLPLATSFSPNPVKHQTDVTIGGTDLDLVKQILFTGVSTPVTSFVSQSATQLVVKVPSSTKDGKVTLVAASGVPTVSSQDLKMLLPSATSILPNPIDPGADVTVTGTNLDLVTSIAFENAPPVTTFISRTNTQIVVTVPAGVMRGKITMAVLNSTLLVQSIEILEINGSVPPPIIALPIYDDAITSNWNGWVGGGWGGSKDLNSTSPVRDGTKSCQINYTGGYGSPLQLGGANVSIGSYTTFKISIYGAPGSGGKRVNIGINGADKYTITVVEGTWTDYSVPISSLTSGSAITEILVKEYNGTGGFTIYVDALGLN